MLIHERFFSLSFPPPPFAPIHILHNFQLPEYSWKEKLVNFSCSKKLFSLHSSRVEKIATSEDDLLTFRQCTLCIVARFDVSKATNVGMPSGDSTAPHKSVCVGKSFKTFQFNITLLLDVGCG